MSQRQSDKAIIKEIKACLGRAKRAAGDMDYWQAKAGARLCDLKKQCGHGHWLPHLKTLRISERRARELMEIAQDPQKLAAMRERVRQAVKKHRSKSALRNADLPDDELEGDTPEEQWQHSMANLCGDILARRALWHKLFGQWEKFSLPAHIKKLVIDAATEFEKITATAVRG